MLKLISEREILEALRLRAKRNLRPVKLELLHLLREVLRPELEELARREAGQAEQTEQEVSQP